MTKVEEDADKERPLNLDLAREICPACHVECRVGEKLAHKKGCIRENFDKDKAEVVG